MADPIVNDTGFFALMEKIERDSERHSGASPFDIARAVEYLLAQKKSQETRLSRIAEIIEDVDGRCCAADGPVTPTLKEMTQAELSEIYSLAKNDPRFLQDSGIANAKDG